MGAVFSERYKFDLWLRIEMAVAEGWAREGRIPEPALQQMRKLARFNLRRMRQYELKVEHEVVAFVSTVGETLGELSRFFHLGLTSSDVMDTALSLQMQEAWALLIPEVERLKDKVGALALKHRRSVMIGRTHGIHAEPITFGLKVLVWYEELKRDLARLEQAREETRVGKLSGAVGNFAHIPPGLEEWALAKLGLKPEPVSNQIVQRDRHAAALCALAILGGTIERIAVEIRSLQRTEIAEVAEPFLAGQKGSSSMPHKRNPILCERMSGMARMLRGFAHTVMENQPLWNERDISHSSAERVVVPDAFILADYMVAKMHFIIDGLVVSPKRMEENLMLTKGLIFSQRLLLALAEKGLSRDEAYRLVQEPAMRAFQEGKHFYALVKDSREIRRHLSLNELSDVFSAEPYLRNVDALFRRAGLLAEGEPPATAGRRAAGKRRRGTGPGPRVAPRPEAGGEEKPVGAAAAAGKEAAVSPRRSSRRPRRRSRSRTSASRPSGSSSTAKENTS